MQRSSHLAFPMGGWLQQLVHERLLVCLLASQPDAKRDGPAASKSVQSNLQEQIPTVVPCDALEPHLKGVYAVNGLLHVGVQLLSG
jgi:hypothetical protein